MSDILGMLIIAIPIILIISIVYYFSSKNNKSKPRNEDVENVRNYIKIETLKNIQNNMKGPRP
ncbi:MAG: hypothetical protein ACI4EH_12700 [Oliverpabstia sp.]